MNIILTSPLSKRHQVKTRTVVLSLVVALISACGGSGGGDANGSIGQETPAVVQPPLNSIASASLRDTNGTAQQLSGILNIHIAEAIPANNSLANAITLYWADNNGNALFDTPFTQLEFTINQTQFTLNDHSIPDNAQAILVFPNNEAGNSEEGFLVSFQDFKGNAELSGPGGNEQSSWNYGADRPRIPIQRDESQGLCMFDNGLVSVIDMNNTREASNHDGIHQSNTADDITYPPYAFQCDPNPVNTYRAISDEVGVWTYSTLNDAMHYGTHVYDTFLKYLNEPPLEDKIRLRVHYGNELDVSAFWDGAYANFSDGYLSHYSLATLDIIAHEVAHGVLDRISALKIYESQTNGTAMTQDMRTLHEAFSDISGVIAKYEYTQGETQWIHGEESNGWVRNLDQIVTERGAIASFLDYAEANNNAYLRIGMMTYPFYLLTQRWGVERAYDVYLNAAKQCWQPTSTLPAAAYCIQQQAITQELPEQDVINAFKAVKIKLFDEGVLSHFTLEANSLTVTLNDTSQSTTTVTQWLWDFGDGTQSSNANPQHSYAQAGEYTIRLTVTDQSNDQDTFERTITINEN